MEIVFTLKLCFKMKHSEDVAAEYNINTEQNKVE